ncbi:NUDIX domain-containing protein [Sphingobium sp. AN558]|uniref:NUDIX domain-containing protein n=1 Tax=Sphingobium sp. AN558 TaxID=3133442 RepID=UPI0030C161F1
MNGRRCCGCCWSILAVPIWRNRDKGAWQIPKGGIQTGESPAATALREVQEELGLRVEALLVPLGEIRQKGGKLVTAFAAEQAVDRSTIISNHFELEWPPRSGETRSFPEVDAARWLSMDDARDAMLPSQLPLLDRLEEALHSGL